MFIIIRVVVIALSLTYYCVGIVAQTAIAINMDTKTYGTAIGFWSLMELPRHPARRFILTEAAILLCHRSLIDAGNSPSWRSRSALLRIVTLTVA